MHNAKSHHLFWFLLFFLFTVGYSFAQNTVDLSNVDLIVYNKQKPKIRFFQKNGSDLYSEIGYVYYGRNTPTMIRYNYNGKNNPTKTLETGKKMNDLLLDENDVLLSPKDLKQYNLKNLLKTEYEIIDSSKNNNKFILKFFKNSISTIQEFYFGAQKYGGFGRYIIKADKDEEKWRIRSARYYRTIDLDFGEDRHIYLMSNDKLFPSLHHIFIPSEKLDLLVSYSIGPRELSDTTLYKTTYAENFRFFEYYKFYARQKNESKYTLTDQFGNALINKAYDSIVYNRYFIIGQNKDHADIYNSLLEPVPLNDVKVAYIENYGIEILGKNSAYYYSADLQITDKLPPEKYLVCGTVPSTNYDIKFNEKAGLYSVTKTEGGARNTHRKMIYYLNDIKRSDSVSFLNGSRSYYKDGNDFFTDDVQKKYPSFLKVSRENKSGIYQYNYHRNLYPMDTISTKWKMEIHYEPTYIKGEVVLPIVNDSITYGQDGLVYFYQNNKVGIFPRHQEVQYDGIRKVTNSFYIIYRDQKKYWLDIQTNTEYHEN